MTLNENETSLAAVSAIAALQKRIRILENEKIQIQSQIEELQQKFQTQDNDYSIREKELQSVTERANRIIEESKCSLSQIKEDRALNISLKQQISQYNELIEQKNSESQQNHFNKNHWLQIQKKTRQIINDYDILLQMFYSPTRLIGKRKNLLKSKLSSDINVLPLNSRRIVQLLQQLPSTYNKQTNKIKRSILQGIRCSLHITNDLTDQIFNMEKQLTTSKTPRSLTYEINKLVTEFEIISKEINRFKF